VERNRVRRRLREVVRLSAAAEVAPLRSGHDYVLIGRRAALSVPFAEMMQDLDKALIRVHAAGKTASRGIDKGTAGGVRRDALHEAGSPRSRKRRSSLKSQASPDVRKSAE
jgi:Ribonuclease P